MFVWTLRETWALFTFYKHRFLAGLLGIILGVGAACLLLALNEHVQKNSAALLEKYGGSRLVLHLIPHGVSQHKAVQRFDPAMLGAQYQFVAYELFGKKARYQFREVPFSVVGAQIGLFSLMSWPVQGRGWEQNAKEIVVGHEVAQQLGSDHTLSVGGSYFSVVGVLPPVDLNPLLDFDPNRTIFLDIQFLHRLGESPGASYLVQGVWPLSQMQEQLRRDLGRQLPADAIFIRDARVFQQALVKQTQFLKTLLAWICGITLLLGISSLMNVLCLLMIERKSEMGLRLALGATISQVAWRLWQEVLGLCIVGTLVGSIFGCLASVWLIQYLGLDFYGVWHLLVVMFPLALVLSGVVAALPLWVMTRWSPIQLLTD